MSLLVQDEPGSHARYREARRFGALDGLRALAAAAVVWHHSGHSTGYFGRSLGVTTFFVISGFLITRLLFLESDRTGTISVMRFWLRRVLRIFPLYYAVLAAYLLLVTWFEGGTPSGAGFWASLPYYLTFTTNWFVSREPGERVIFYFAWSIALQEQFYLIWPLILRLVRRRYAFVAPLVLLVSGELATSALDAGWLQHRVVHRALVSADSPIFLGVLAAFLLHDGLGYRIGCAVAGRTWSLPAAFLLVLLPAWFPNVPQDLLGLFITYLVVACVLAPAATVRVLDNPVATHIGNVSFGIYLLHMLALNAVRRVLPGQGSAVVFALGFPLAILAATASRRWFELPFLRLRDDPSRHPRAQPGGASGSTAALTFSPAADHPAREPR